MQRPTRVQLVALVATLTVLFAVGGALGGHTNQDPPIKSDDVPSGPGLIPPLGDHPLAHLGDGQVAVMDDVMYVGEAVAGTKFVLARPIVDLLAGAPLNTLDSCHVAPIVRPGTTCSIGRIQADQLPELLVDMESCSVPCQQAPDGTAEYVVAASFYSFCEGPAETTQAQPWVLPGYVVPVVSCDCLQGCLNLWVYDVDAGCDNFECIDVTHEIGPQPCIDPMICGNLGDGTIN